jgi:hypothetical protein
VWSSVIREGRITRAAPAEAGTNGQFASFRWAIIRLEASHAIEMARFVDKTEIDAPIGRSLIT